MNSYNGFLTIWRSITITNFSSSMSLSSFLSEESFGPRGNYWDNYTGPASSPAEIPGYDLFLVSFVGVVLIIGIIFKSKKKKSNP